MTISDDKRLVLLFGPSGIGKSTAIKFANERIQGVIFEPLDALTKQLGRELKFIREDQGIRELQRAINNPDKFLELGIQAVNRLVANNPSQTVVIDVGAGFLDGSRISDWIANNISVVLCASSQVAYERIQTNRNDTRTFDEYREQEFAAHRERLYFQAQYKIDATCNAEQLGLRFIELLTGLISGTTPTESAQQ